MKTIPFPTDLPEVFIPYASGQSDSFVVPLGTKRKLLEKVKNYRRAYLRNLLRSDPAAAYGKPDFEELMRDEIWHYAKRTLKQQVFQNWDEMLVESRLLRTLFEKEYKERLDEYFARANSNKAVKKLSYVQMDAKRHAFHRCTEDPEGLGSLECACFGETRYGM